jgi:hypothetical protein
VRSTHAEVNLLLPELDVRRDEPPPMVLGSGRRLTLPLAERHENWGSPVPSKNTGLADGR